MAGAFGEKNTPEHEIPFMPSGFEEERRRDAELLEQYGFPEPTTRSDLAHIEDGYPTWDWMSTVPSVGIPRLPRRVDTQVDSTDFISESIIEYPDGILPRFYEPDLNKQQTTKIDALLRKEYLPKKISKPYDEKNTYPSDEDCVNASGRRVILGVALEQEAQTQAEIAKVKRAIEAAGLDGRNRIFGRVEVLDPFQAHIRSAFPNTMGGAITDFYVKASSADDLRALADQLEALESPVAEAE